jgi:hypothetical protein
MNKAFPTALTAIDPAFVRGITLPDKNDLHVLAGALTCNAAVIVTANLKDFPKTTLSMCGIRAEHPDVFCASLINEDPRIALEAFLEQVSNLKMPALSSVEVLDRLAKIGMRESAARLCSLLS